MNDHSEAGGTGGDRPPGPERYEGFRARKREDHALILIEQLRSSLDDLPRARRLLLELGRYYDPVLGGAVMEVEHQRRVMAALEGGRKEEALGMIQERYERYVKDRAHLGPGGG